MRTLFCLFTPSYQWDLFWHFGQWLVDPFWNVLGKTVVSCLWIGSNWEVTAVKLYMCIEYFFYRMQKSKSKSVLKPAEICDLLKACILIACSMIMSYIDTSMMYHLIKSQSVIKLYIFFNMLEVRICLYRVFLVASMPISFCTFIRITFFVIIIILLFILVFTHSNAGLIGWTEIIFISSLKENQPCV